MNLDSVRKIADAIQYEGYIRYPYRASAQKNRSRWQFGVMMAPDTEAIFVHKSEVFLIPIDMCYSLVGELRLYWQGFDGGAEAREALARFLAGLRRRAVALEREH